MKRLFAKYLKEEGSIFTVVPSKAVIQKITLAFNDWMIYNARKRNYEIHEFANNFMVRKFIEKLV